MNEAMRVVGLTGGIASGKSTVSAMFRQLGTEVLDADVLAREVVEPGQSALADIAREFPSVIEADGQFNRKKLGQLVFADPQARQKLNGIIHPRIRERFRNKVDALAAQGIRWCLYDAPLLFETRLDAELHGVVLVDVPESTQLERLRWRDGLTEPEAKARLTAQMPRDEKRKRATWIIDNTGALDDTRAQVEQIWKTLEANSQEDGA